MNAAESYDQIAEFYDAQWTRPIDRAEDEVLFGEFRGEAEGSAVLDVGCGTGRLLDFIDPATYVGVDPSAAMLEVARHRHPGKRFLQSYADRTLGMLAMGRFDLAVALWCFSYFEKPKVALAGMHRALRPGGRCVVHACAPGYHERGSYSLAEAPPPYLPYTPAQLERLMLDAGFRYVRVTGFRFFSDGVVRFVPERWLPSLLRWESRNLPPENAMTLIASGRR